MAFVAIERYYQRLLQLLLNDAPQVLHGTNGEHANSVFRSVNFCGDVAVRHALNEVPIDDFSMR